MASRKTIERTQRVVALLNAISDLREDDLRIVFKLDYMATLSPPGPSAVFEMDNGELTFHELPARTNVEGSTGKHLARDLEIHLENFLGLGQLFVPHRLKGSQAAADLGQEVFSSDPKLAQRRK